MKHHLLVALGAACLAALSMGCKSEAYEGVEGGKILFANNCAVCHGTDGGGNVDIAAPAIAGLQDWYVIQELHNFRDGDRGAHYDDIEGLRMKPMAMTLRSEAEFEAVTAYVASMPPVPQKPTLEGGDPAKGATLYATCMACHGPDAKGMEALKAPSLKVTPDWYQFAQIKKYQDGIRGVSKGDITGQQMRPMAATLADDQAIKDVLAHIATLGN